MAEEKKKNDLGRDWLNALFSALNPEIRAFAERFAASIPEGHWLRHPLVERLVGVLGGRLERESEKMGPVLGVLVEKFTDFIDFASPNLFKKDSKGVVRIGRDWMSGFLKYAEKRLSEAAPENINTELARLQAEFEARKQIVAMLEEAVKAAEPAKSTSEPINWDAEWNKIKGGVKRFLKKIDTHLAPVADRLEALPGGGR